GATALDFAYIIHSNVGDHAERAVINGQKMPMATQLKTGDQVDIETHPDISPLPHWLNYAKTARSRSHIRNHINAAGREGAAMLGEKLLKKSLGQLAMTIDDIAPEDWRVFLGGNGLAGRADLYLALGLGKILPDIAARGLARRQTGKGGKNAPLLIAGSGNAAIKLSTCCNPLPFEPIIGVLKKDHGLVVHSSLCPTVPKLNRRSQKWIEVAWHDNPGRRLYSSAITLECRNRPGLITGISGAISKRDINIVTCNFDGGGLAHSAIILEMIVEVPNLAALEALLIALNKMPEVLRAERRLSEEQPTT
ncbi:MAG: TGS domain-containing protein, partial [Gammaproteobacteria bacterium]